MTNRPRWQTLGILFGSHPWHGVPYPKDGPAILTCYIEMVQTDTVKYALDELTGLLKVDRPQKYSKRLPRSLRLDQALCAERVGAFCSEKTGRSHEDYLTRFGGLEEMLTAALRD